MPSQKTLALGSILLACNAVGTGASVAIGGGAGGGFDFGLGGGAQGGLDAANAGFGGGASGGLNAYGNGGAGVGVEAGAGAGLNVGGNFDGNAGLYAGGNDGSNVDDNAGGNVGGNAGVSAGGSDAGFNAGGNAELNAGGHIDHYPGQNAGGNAGGSANINVDQHAGVGANVGSGVEGGAGGNAAHGVSAGGAGGVTAGIGGEFKISWPDLQVGIVPGGNAAPVYTPAAALWPSAPKPKHNADAVGDFLTPDQVKDAAAPQYTIHGGPAKCYYFPSNVAAVGDAPDAHVTPAPGKKSSPVGGAPGLGSDSLLTADGNTFSPGYVYMSFATLYAGCEIDGKMETVGPNYANKMYSFKTDEISTRCVSTAMPDATSPVYGPPAAVNWDELNAAVEKGDRSCLHFAPPAGFLNVVPPEWQRQLYWDAKFEPPTKLMQEIHAVQPTLPSKVDGAAVVETPVATGDCMSGKCPPGVAAGTAGVVATTGSVDGITPYTGGSNPHHGGKGRGGWKMVAVGMVVGLATVIALL